MKRRGPGFFPEEIIFSVTDFCNLHCPHCFVSRKKTDLDFTAATRFLKSCKEAHESQIQKIGFSGGEPFLKMDFLCNMIKEGVQNDFLFDRIMTNGDWWKDKSELQEKLTAIYDAGFDGKFGLSWDSFHGQDFERILTFSKTLLEIFGGQTLEIQTVLTGNQDSDQLMLKKIEDFATILGCSIINQTNKKGLGFLFLENPTKGLAIQIALTPQTFPASSPKAWQSKKWFKEDFCQGPGNILFIHPDGNIAPCCGFANESPALFLGNINEEGCTFQKVIENAACNKMIKICFEEGLSSQIKILKKQGRLTPGKTDDICSFCGYVTHPHY